REKAGPGPDDQGSMLMPGLRPFALMQTDDQWVRCAHWQTRLHGGDEGIELGFQPVQPDDAPTAAPKLAAGLAFDAECRFYRSDPERGEVERSLWSPADARSEERRVGKEGRAWWSP